MVANCGGWTEQDKTLICRLKLTGAAATCVAGFPTLMEPTATLEQYRQILKERFDSVQSPAEKLLQLNSVCQRPGEKVKEFADRCRRLGEETIPNEARAAAEMEWARKQAMQVTQAAFVKGLRGEIGLPLRYQSPSSFNQAVEMATRIEDAQSQVPYPMEDRAVQGTSREEGKAHTTAAVVGIICYRCQQGGHLARDCPKKGLPSAQNTSIQRQWEGGKPKLKGSCFVCGQAGHFARNCAKRANPAKICVCQHAEIGKESAPKGNGPSGAPPAGPNFHLGPQY